MVAHKDNSQTETTPAEVLDRLKEGNVRFLNNLRAQRDPHHDLDRHKNGQQPQVAVVACMDSRVSTETVFDIGIGDMFSLRIAGNVMTEGIIGSLEYATAVVGTKLVVIMGHTCCGAVTAACDHVELGNLTALLAGIQPAVQLAPASRGGARTGKNPEFVQAVADLNVQLAAEQLPQRSPIMRRLVEEGKLAIVSAMYDVASGQVRFHEPIPTSAPTLAVPRNRLRSARIFGTVAASLLALCTLTGCYTANSHTGFGQTGTERRQVVTQHHHLDGKEQRHFHMASGSFDASHPFGSRRNQHD